MFEREAEVAQRAAREAAEVIARHGEGDGGRHHWDKADESPLTQADLEANEAIERVLGEAFPDDAVLTEERADSAHRLSRERVWIVDPLDGTKEFVAAIPEYAVSVALVVAGEPVVGAVCQPVTRELFWGGRGLGAHLGSQPIRVSDVTRLEDAVALVSRTEISRNQIDPWKDWFREVRPVGSVAFKLAYAAAGRGDLWISAAPKNEWDVCGGDCLVRAAGGTFQSRAEGERVYNSRELLMQPPMAAGPKALVETFLSRVQS